MTYKSMSFGPQMVRLYALPSSSTGLTNPSNNYIHEYVGDYVLHLYNACAAISEPFPLASVLSLGKIPTEIGKVDDWSLGRPVTPSYNSQLDRAYFGPRGIAASWFRNPLMEASLELKEKPVSHTSFRGDVQDSPGYTDLYELHFRDTFFGSIPGVRRKYPQHTPLVGARAIGFTDEGYLEFEFRESFTPEYATYHPLFNLIEFIDEMVEKVPGITFSPGPGWTYTWTDFVNRSRQVGNRTVVDFTYSLHMQWSGGGETVNTVWQVHCYFIVAFSEVYGSQSVFDWNDVSPAVSIHSDCKVECVSYRYRYAPTGYDGYFDPSLYTLAPVVPSFDLSIVSLGLPAAVGIYSVSGMRLYPGMSNLMAFRRHGSSDPFNLIHNLERLFELDFPDLVPSSFHSASEALRAHMEVLEANHLENLTQLGGILSVLPNFKDISQIVSRGVKGDPRVVLDIADYVADAVLKFKFQQRPLSQDVAELARADISGQLTQLSKPSQYTIYGSREWQLPLKVPWDVDGKIHLESRSKIRVDVDLSTLLATLLSANSVGILPTLSRIWDLVPFSFVVDWFLDMGDRLKSLDDSALWMCVTTKWCLHSFRYIYYPSSDYLAEFQLVSSGERPFGLSVYQRHLSLYTPTLRDSKFDFHVGSDPNVATVGAFTYKLLRS